ncbi:MAG: hypothetical protein ACLRSW_04250 [Christensenellaceae bacterium]
MTVTDYTLSDEVTAKSCFLLQALSAILRRQHHGKLREILRVSGGTPRNAHAPAALNYDISDYTARAHEYAARGRFLFAVPYKETYSKTHKDIDVDWDFLEEMTRSLALKAIETGVNIVGKCYYYFGIMMRRAWAALKTEPRGSVIRRIFSSTVSRTNLRPTPP